MAKKHQEHMILVGFGKQDLKDMLYKIDTDEEDELIYAPTNSPPRFRRIGICSETEVNAFVTYTNWATEKLKGNNATR